MSEIEWIPGREYETRGFGNVICINKVDVRVAYPVLLCLSSDRKNTYCVTFKGRYYDTLDGSDARDVIRGPLPVDAKEDHVMVDDKDNDPRLAIPGPDPTPETCGNCRFCLPSVDTEGQGVCRLNPPSEPHMGGHVFVSVYLSWWCGQWEAKR